MVVYFLDVLLNLIKYFPASSPVCVEDDITRVEIITTTVDIDADTTARRSIKLCS